MPDSWEDYLKENRAELDVFQPEEDRMWQKIDNRLKRSANAWRKYLLRVSVAAGILLFIGIITRHELMMREQIHNLSAINEELAEKERHYIDQVNLKWDELRSLPSTDAKLDLLLLDELELLDTIYNKGLNDIKQHGYNERAVLIMLDTYEKRLRIIERLINEKRKQQKDENKSKHIRI